MKRVQRFARAHVSLFGGEAEPGEAVGGEAGGAPPTTSDAGIPPAQSRKLSPSRALPSRVSVMRRRPPPFDASVLREEGFSGFVRRGASCLGYCVAQLLYSADVFSHRGWSYNLKWTFRVLLRIVLPFAVLGLLISLMSWLIVLLGDILTGVIGTVLWVLLWTLPLMAGIAVAVLAARFFLWVTKKETVPRWVAYFTERRRAAK